jgi:Flp pilus assembly pilin Flp
MGSMMRRVHVNEWLRQFACDRRGATAIEYALVASCISIAIAGSATLLGSTVTEYFDKVAAAFEQAGDGAGGGDNN